MQATLINIGLGFIEGFLLIISPCILPILPIILAGSLTGSKKRPFGIILGFIIIFALFTFFSRALVQYLGIDLNAIRHASYALLLLLGIIMMSSTLTEKFTQLTQNLANIGTNFSFINNSQGGFASGILFGGLIALVWTPCAGPILAAVIVQTVIQKTNVMAFLTVLAFGIGAAVPMLIIVLFGRRIMDKFSFFKQHTITCRKALGGILILGVAYMLAVESGIFLPFSAPVTAAPVHNKMASNNNSLENALTNPYQAPKIAGINEWINSPPLQLDDLKGKVVLVDFWTYSCINCVRTLPYLNDWYKKYQDKGLVIIGVHSPEFDFEKNVNNVKNAVEKYGIKYPVALDSQFVTWQNFNNSTWPAHYLINKEGKVVYQQFGEGDYKITENNIRFLLGLKPDGTLSASSPLKVENFSFSETPETYLGYARAEHFSSPESPKKNQKAQYTLPQKLSRDQWALQGAWTITADRIVAEQSNAALKLHFNAAKVFIVMGNATQTPIRVQLRLNDKSIVGEKGKDVVQSSIEVGKHSLYSALVFNQSTDGILEVIASTPGLEIYTFTFGE